MMIYPNKERKDDNPLHMLCRNDVCSFTWTGPQHINQVCILFMFLQLER